MINKLIGATFVAAMMASTAMAADVKPALVYGTGGKFDKSFNEAAYNGMERFRKETGGSYLEFEIANDTQREQAFRRMAQKGANPIIGIGFTQASALEKVAKEFPQLKFAIVDMVVNLPNVQSVVFKEQEGSFLAGMAAAMASRSGKVGFIGGMDVPLIHKFECGYRQGFAAAKPDGKVLINYTGTTPAAWNDPVKGGELTKAQKGQGADIVFAAAGGTGIGVLQAAADEGILSIGVDSNQNHLHPGKVLTSVVKRVDNAVYDAFKAGEAVEPGLKVWDVKSDGVGVAMDDNNKPLVTPEIAAAVEDARAKIASGEVVVHDYMTDNTCPVD